MGSYLVGATNVIYGVGCLKDITKAIDQLNGRKLFVVSDRGIERAGLLEKLMENLKGYETVVYNELDSEPLDYIVDNGVEKYKEEKCDVIIGFGGGSSMDTAKCISLLSTNGGKIMEYHHSCKEQRFFTVPREKLILVPTSSGTGSEMSTAAVVTNTALHRKCSFGGPLFHPDYSIVDPLMTVSLPTEVTRNSAMDALGHAVESITSKQSASEPNPLMEALALKAISLVARNVRQAYAQPNNIEARANVMYGADIAGLCLGGGSGPTHSLSNILSKYHNAPHGLGIGVLLPYCMEYNLMALPETFRKIAVAIGVNVEGMTDMEAGRAGIRELKEIIKDIQLPKLCEIMESENEIEEYAWENVENICSYNNVRKIDLAAAKEIFYNAYKGE